MMKFYRIDLIRDESGFVLQVKEFVTIHESPCTCFCVAAFELDLIKKANLEGETLLQTAKRVGKFKVRRIGKTFSKIAQPTKEQALENFKARRRKYIEILSRKLEDSKVALGKIDGVKIDEFKEQTTFFNRAYTWLQVPDTREYLHSQYFFE